MSAFKGTPGPWETDELYHDAPHQNIHVVSGWRVICEVWIDDAPVPYYNAEQRANARLIAAAPELLAACRKLVEWHGNRAGFGDDLLPADQQVEWVADAMRAIAKATGEQS